MWEVVIEFFTDNGGHAEQSIAIPINGFVRALIIDLPVTTATGTTSTTTIDDSNGRQFHTSTALAEGTTGATATSQSLSDFPVEDSMTVSLDVSADPTGSGVTNTVTIGGFV